VYGVVGAADTSRCDGECHGIGARRSAACWRPKPVEPDPAERMPLCTRPSLTGSASRPAGGLSMDESEPGLIRNLLTDRCPDQLIVPWPEASAHLPPPPTEPPAPTQRQPVLPQPPSNVTYAQLRRPPGRPVQRRSTEVSPVTAARSWTVTTTGGVRIAPSVSTTAATAVLISHHHGSNSYPSTVRSVRASGWRVRAWRGAASHDGLRVLRCRHS
jgi:hypothetical protein